ncbi:putative E3 ubiquitin-protein ligase makorin-2 [Scleropages formosus]|uniref:E3 ubiquitin-protein ligase makorin-2 n=1 Tax=Scleropages formosus TaxID=113540 RepID=A0A0P7WW93_SCLFO|nr:putative E3 ubiquitin-protein ligase makorin-2 [Scleropages formosus]
MLSGVFHSRYFLHGVCREGPRCLFSHDLSASKPSTACRFYLKGACAYGERCRYDHIKPPAGRGTSATTDQTSRGGSVTTPVAVSGSSAGLARRGKKPLVLKDRALGIGTEERTTPDGRNSRALQERESWEYWEEGAQAKPHSYLEAIRTGLEASPNEMPFADLQLLCPYAAAGHCHYGSSCSYLHGDKCDICQLQVLHPYDPEQRRAHEKMCMVAFEADMEKAFAAQFSQDKVCSICMEVVYEKATPSERRFGILSSCSHTYCLGCIRQWRCAKQFENKIVKSCPECRVVSEFVIPSVFWVEDQEQKNRLIEEFKAGVSKKACKYFDQGRGTCPFGGKCLYLHAYPDGTRAEPEKPRKQLGSEGNVRFLNSVRLWDFIEEREHRTTSQYDDEVSELGDLFMQLSGAGEEGGVPVPH